MSRTSIRRVALAVAAVVVMAVPANAQISVVVSASSPYNPSVREIAEMFMGIQATWADGAKVQLVDQPDTPVGRQFYSVFLQQSAAAVRQRITRRIFAGEALPPERVANSAAVRAAVARNPRAIGFIDSSALDGSVREVHRIER